MRLGTWIACGVGIVTLAGTPLAAAKDPASPGAKALAEAKAHAAQGAWKDAGSAFGRAAAETHAAKDLVAEDAVADAFVEAADAADDAGAKAAAPVAGTTDAPAPLTDLLGAAMAGLDPKRHGALVSAHALATELVLRATHTGRPAHLAAAADVLATFAATPGAGRLAPTLAAWAGGVRAAFAKDAAKAAPALEAAAAAFATAGCVDLALAAATEHAVVEVARGDVARAAAVLEAEASTLPFDPDPAVVRAWLAAVALRLAPLPDAVTKAMKPVTDKYAQVGLPGADGGRGGNGAAEDGLSALGRLWRTLGAEKPFVRATRGATGFVVRGAFDKALQEERPPTHGQSTWDAGGVTLHFAGPAVALGMVDLVGTRGQEGGRSTRSPARAFYFVADGETFAVAKRGVTVGP